MITIPATALAPSCASADSVNVSVSIFNPPSAVSIPPIFKSAKLILPPMLTLLNVANPVEVKLFKKPFFVVLVSLRSPTSFVAAVIIPPSIVPVPVSTVLDSTLSKNALTGVILPITTLFNVEPVDPGATVNVPVTPNVFPVPTVTFPSITSPPDNKSPVTLPVILPINPLLAVIVVP